MVLPEPELRCATRRISRNADGLAVMTAAVALDALGEMRVALAGVTPQPMRLRDVERHELRDAALEAAVSALIAPRGSRRQRGLQALYQRGSGGGSAGGVPAAGGTGMMELNFTLNGALRTVITPAGENAQRVLFNQCRMHSVRNSDDGFGFAGSDAILFNGKVINASLLIAAQLEGRRCAPPSRWAAGTSSVWCSRRWWMWVWCGPATTIRLRRSSSPTCLIATPSPPAIKSTTRFSGLFHRDGGYQQFYQAIELACSRMKDPDYLCQIAPEFRDDLRHIGKSCPKVDAAKMVQAKPCYVEDRVSEDALVIKMLRSPIPMR